MSYGAPQYGEAFTWQFQLMDAATGLVPQTGKAGSTTVTLSQEGGAFAALTGPPSVSEIASGWYEITVAVDDMEWATAIIFASCAGCRSVWERMYIDRAARIAHARFANKGVNKKDEGKQEVYAENGSTLLRTFELSEVDGDIVSTPS